MSPHFPESTKRLWLVKDQKALQSNLTSHEILIENPFQKLQMYGMTVLISISVAVFILIIFFLAHKFKIIDDGWLSQFIVASFVCVALFFNVVCVGFFWNYSADIKLI